MSDLNSSGSTAPPGQQSTANKHNVSTNSRAQLLMQRELEALHDRFQRMQRDYSENTRIAEQLGAQLEATVSEKEQLEKQLKALEMRYTAMSAAVQAQDEKLAAAESDKKRYTEGLRSEIETLTAQVQSLMVQKGTAERQAQELQVEVVAVKAEIASKNSDVIHKVEAARSEARMDARGLLDEKERVMRQRVETLQVQQRELELANVELQSKFDKQREVATALEHKMAEKDQLIARRNATIDTLEAQINEQRRTASLHETQLQTELTTLKAAKDQVEKTNSTHLHSVQQDIERRGHEVATLEERVSAMRHQHETDIRRRQEEKEELQRTAESKQQQLAEKIRILDKATSEQQINNERLTQQVKTLKEESKKHDEVHHRMVEELAGAERMLANKAKELEVALGEGKRHAAKVAEKEKEMEMLRNEFERRDWADKTTRSERLQQRVGNFGDRTSLRFTPENEDLYTTSTSMARSGLPNHSHSSNQRHLTEHSAASPSRHHSYFGPAASPSRIHQMNGTAAAATPAAHTATLEVLNEIKATLDKQQQQGATMGNTTHHGQHRTMADEAQTPLAHTVTMLSQQLADVKMQQEDDRLQLERRVAEAQRDADRQRRKVERLLQHRNDSNISAASGYAVPAAVPEESILRSVDTSRQDGVPSNNNSFTQQQGAHHEEDLVSEASTMHSRSSDWLRRAAATPTAPGGVQTTQKPTHPPSRSTSPAVQRLMETKRQLEDMK